MPKKISKITVKSISSWSLSQKVLSAEQIKGDTRKEIQRAFHAANRRIQNIESKGYYSPALQSLKSSFDDRANMSKFAKFSASGMTDAELKIEYAKAISFLKQPTSTATGAKEYEKRLQTELGLDDTQFKATKEKIMENDFSEAQSDYAKKYWQRYKDMINAFKREAESVASQLESEAEQITSGIEEYVNKVGSPIGENIAIKDIMDSFSRFGM